MHCRDDITPEDNRETDQHIPIGVFEITSIAGDAPDPSSPVSLRNGSPYTFTAFSYIKCSTLIGNSRSRWPVA